MKQILLVILTSLITKFGISQLTPNDIFYKRTIPGDSLLLVVDSMIVTTYQVYLDEYSNFRGYPNYPTKMKVFIKGYEKVDSVSLKAIKSKIEIQISDLNYLTDYWKFALLRPGDRHGSFIYSVERPMKDGYKSSVSLDNEKILNAIKVGDFIVVTGITCYHKTTSKLFDPVGVCYRVVE
jgi:hypothetical protein